MFVAQFACTSKAPTTKYIPYTLRITIFMRYSCCGRGDVCMNLINSHDNGRISNECHCINLQSQVHNSVFFRRFNINNNPANNCYNVEDGYDSPSVRLASTTKRDSQKFNSSMVEFSNKFSGHFSSSLALFHDSNTFRPISLLSSVAGNDWLT